MTNQPTLSDYSDRLRKSEWAVRPVALAVAQDMVERLHYSAGGSNTAVYVHGLFELARPASIRGVAWWIPPTRSAAEATYHVDWEGVLALSRMVIEASVPKNAATFLLARSMRLIDRLRWPCLVTYADEWQGHTGTIYRACNWAYVGMTKPEATFVREGRMLSRKAGNRTKTRDEMAKLGAEMIGRFAKHKFIHIAAGSGKRIERQAGLFGEAA
jgi:hypothetical protein